MTIAHNRFSLSVCFFYRSKIADMFSRACERAHYNSDVAFVFARLVLVDAVEERDRLDKEIRLREMDLMFDGAFF